MGDALVGLLRKAGCNQPVPFIEGRPLPGNAQGPGYVLAGVVEKLSNEWLHRPSLDGERAHEALGQGVIW